MASILDPGILMFRVYKHHINNSMLVWANTYEIQQGGGTHTISDITTAAQELAAAEAHIALTSTIFDRVVVSTWVKDGTPYNPASFVSIPVNQQGLRDPSGNGAEPLTMCLRIAKQTETGRLGYSLYRNFLLESDVASPAGTPVLTISVADQAIQGYLTAMGAYRGPTANYELVLYNGSLVRPVLAQTLSGVTEKKLNNRYFDKK